MIILDTNVISEIIKKQPDEHVANWLRNQDTSNLATTAITVAELLVGICRMPEGKRRKYTDTTVKLALMTLEDRTFAFDTQQLRIMPISLSNANAGAHLPVFKTP